MKEFIEKLIGRLKEELGNVNFEKATKEVNEPFHDGLAYAYGYSISIVNQLAEEYTDKNCSECSRRKWYQIGYADAEKKLAEEYNGGWIPCSERLPEVEADVLLSLRSLDVYTGFRANTEGCFYVEGEGYVEFENVLAWKPLPQPFVRKDD